MKIMIVGYGVVGKAVHNALHSMHDIVIVDPRYSSEQVVNHPDADGVIICLGTTSTESGECDDSPVRLALSEIPVFLPILIKSTILPNQLTQIEEDCEEYEICYSPEFLRAEFANQDFLNQKYMIIGGSDPDGFWEDIFRSVLPNCNMYLHCSMNEASLVKHAVTAFLATKVAFFNQLFDMCDASRSNFDIVRQLVCLDPRINSSHSIVPGNHGRGFDGSSFPKDTSAFIQYARQIDQPIDILETVVDYNEKLRKNS